MRMDDFSKEELRILKKLNTGSKIQDFLDSLKANFEEGGETCMSPRRVLRTGKCHCMEGAMLAAAALRVNGNLPLVIDLRATDDDWDHVITIFKQHDHWGAISKTNHSVLRYREPVYSTIRELVMSFFHEYLDEKDEGRKTLREFSIPVDLRIFDSINWMTSEEELWEIPEYLDKVEHLKILNRAQKRGLRKAHDTEIKAGKIIEWVRPNKKI